MPLLNLGSRTSEHIGQHLGHCCQNKKGNTIEVRLQTLQHQRIQNREKKEKIERRKKSKFLFKHRQSTKYSLMMGHPIKHPIDPETGLCDICDGDAIREIRLGKRPTKRIVYVSQEERLTDPSIDEEEVIYVHVSKTSNFVFQDGIHRFDSLG